MQPKSTRARRTILAMAALSGVLAIGACDSTQGLLASIAGGDTTSSAPAPGSANAAAKPAAVTASPAAVAPIAPALPPGLGTGTPTGAKVGIIRGDMLRLADNINQHNAELQQIRATVSGDANSYLALTGGIQSRLRTAPNDPQLAAQAGQAQALLDRMNGEAAELGVLSAQVASDAAFAAYVAQEIKAASYLRGAVDEDRRQLDALRALADSDMALIERLSQAVSRDYARQTGDIAGRRRSLAMLNAAIGKGRPAARPHALATAAAATPVPEAPPAAPGERRPLVTIRFDHPHIAFEQALYTALSRALQRKPNASFELVAVSPSSGDAAQVSRYAGEAKRNAQNVMHALSRMGLPAERLALSAMTSEQARTSEVQIFVR
ncbi:MAG TPA: hypothetical protein VH020_03840 [Stellaceae bacterium]|nr:hypothetical protein [Stellaceae bacterium]